MIVGAFLVLFFITVGPAFIQVDTSTLRGIKRDHGDEAEILSQTGKP